MAESNKNQKRNRGNRSNRNRNRSRSEQQVYNKGELIHVAFQRRNDGRIASGIGLNELNIDIFPQTMRFVPRCTDPSSQEVLQYYCSVQRFSGRFGDYGLAMPVWPFRLEPDEWLPVERLHEVFVAELTFRKGHRRMITRHEGRTVLLERGHEVPLEKKIRCRLEEHGNSIYAIPLLLVESDVGSAMVSLKDAFDKEGFTDSVFIVVDDIKAKKGVVQVTSEDHVVVVQKYRDVYEILSNARLGITIDASSTVQEVKDAFKQQVSLVHPDTTLRSYKDRDVEPPVMMRMLAESAYKALTDAKDRALTLLEPKVPEKADVSAEGDADQAAEAKATSATVTKKKTTRKKAAAKKKVVKKKAASKKAAATAADDAPASSEVSADATSAEASTSEPAKKPSGESVSQLKKFESKYGDREPSAASAKTPEKPKSDTADTADEKAATDDRGSMADQLASLQLNLGPANK